MLQSLGGRAWCAARCLCRSGVLLAAACAIAARRLQSRGQSGRVVRPDARRHGRIRIHRRSAPGAIPGIGTGAQQRGADAPGGGDVARKPVGLSRARLSLRQSGEAGDHDLLGLGCVRWRRPARLAHHRRGDRQVGISGRRHDAWSAADDAMLQRIARSSMDQLAAFLTSPEVAPGLPDAAPQTVAFGPAQCLTGGGRHLPHYSAQCRSGAERGCRARRRRQRRSRCRRAARPWRPLFRPGKR